MFELTIQFNIEKIGKWAEIWTKLWIKWNFELTVFELTGPNLYLKTHHIGDCMSHQQETCHEKLLL